MSEWEFVRGSKRNKPYIRRAPSCRANPTVYQREVRYFLAKISHESTGKMGTVEYGNTTIPAVAHVIAQKMKGKRFAPEKRNRPPDVLLKLIPAFKELGKAVQSHKFWNRDVVPRLLQWQRFHEEKKKKEKLKEVAT